METMIDDTGAFTEAFQTELPTMLGEEHKDSKAFDDTPDLSTLVRNYANTKAMVGKKMDNVIQKPAEDASDEDKATYKQQLLAGLGAPDSVDGYEFPAPEEGETYAEGQKEMWAGVFHEYRVPKEMATGLINKFHEWQRGQLAEVEKVYQEEVTSFQTDHPGDKMPETMRLAYNAIKEFGTDALKGIMKDSGLYDNHDLAKWRECGFTPDQLRVWANVGRSIGTKQMPQGEVQSPSAIGLSPKDVKWAANAGIPEDAWAKGLREYPKSWAQMNSKTEPTE